MHRHVELALDPPQGLHWSNPRAPYEFENEFCKGKYIFFHPPRCKEHEGAGVLASAAAESHRVPAALRERTRLRRRGAAFLHRAMVDIVIARNSTRPAEHQARGYGAALPRGPGTRPGR